MSRVFLAKVSMAAEQEDGHLDQNPPWESIHSIGDLTNDVAYQIFRHVRQYKRGWHAPACFISALVQHEVTHTSLAAACSRLKDKRLKLMKSHKDDKLLKEYLSEPFKIPAELPKKRKLDEVEQVFQALEVDMNVPVTSNMVKEGAYQSLLADMKQLEEQNRSLKDDLARTEANLKQIEKARLPGQKLSRQSDRISHWKGKYWEMKANYVRASNATMRVDQMRKTIRQLRSSLSSQRHYYKNKEIAALRSHDTCVQKENTLKTRLTDLEWELCQIQQDKSDSPNLIPTKGGHSYNHKMRMCIYFALQHQCPVDHAARIVQFVAQKYTGQELENIPCASTVSQMAREMSTLGDIQAGQVLASTPNLTVAWDATDVAGSHINEVHVAAADQNNEDQPGGREYITLSVAQLPGGKTGDYVTHVEDSIKDVAENYGAWLNADPQAIHTKIKSNISSTLSDRVAVNHCVTDQLKASFNTDIVELHCNVHPLDSLASKARSTLKETGVTGQVFGKDCAAANLIHSLSKLRYKQGSGDPGAFKSYYKSIGFAMTMFPRYVGNRLHILFHLAGIHYFVREHTLVFLDKFCTKRGGLTSSLEKDLKNSDIVRQLCVLGMFGKVLTGPWMTKFYSELGRNLGMTSSLVNCLQFLKKVCDDPALLAKTTDDAFGQELASSDAVLTSLKKINIDTPFKNEVNALAKVFITVLERQLGSYLSEPSDTAKEMAIAAPTHNMHAERIMGMTDAEVRRAPNAQLDFVEAKVKTKTNNTMAWLQDQPEEEQEKLIEYAVSRSRAVRAQTNLRRLSLQGEILRRLKARGHQKDESERRKIEKQVSKLVSGTVTAQIITELAPDLSETDQAFVLRLMNTPASVISTCFLHTWFDAVSQSNSAFRGCIIKQKKTKKCTFIVAYHDCSVEGEEDCEDYVMTRDQLVSDMLCGDLVLC